MSYTVCICNLGLGNISSVVNILKKLGIKSFVTENPEDIQNFCYLIIPGVGAFDYAMEKINKSSWKEKIFGHVEKGGYLLGICLGMQILCTSSEEGDLLGLGLIPGEFKKFDFSSNKIKVPHMGWNTVSFTDKMPSTFKNAFQIESSRYYFVHSYRYDYKNMDYVYGSTDYGIEFASIIGKDNIMGCQFHPETSHVNGLNFLKQYFAYINK